MRHSARPVNSTLVLLSLGLGIPEPGHAASVRSEWLSMSSKALGVQGIASENVDPGPSLAVMEQMTGRIIPIWSGLAVQCERAYPDMLTGCGYARAANHDIR